MPETPPSLKVRGVKRRIGYNLRDRTEANHKTSSPQNAFGDSEADGSATPPPPTPAGDEEMDSGDEEARKENEERRKRPCHAV